MRSGFTDMNQRERGLAVLLIAVALPFALWFFGLQPLLQARDRALAALASALETQVWVREQDTRWRASGTAAATSDPVTPVGLAGLEAELVAANLRGQVTTLENTDSGGISLGLDDVDFVALGQVLQRIETDLGYEIATLRITRTDQLGQVDARISLLPRVP